MKFEFSGKIFEKYINNKFHAIRSVGAEFHAEEQTDERMDR
jgi:hypothetical protein